MYNKQYFWLRLLLSFIIFGTSLLLQYCGSSFRRPFDHFTALVSLLTMCQPKKPNTHLSTRRLFFTQYIEGVSLLVGS